ncbi:hypothetical protein AIGOOFII_2667 [Methylobacterium marchantiae]|nr:hypothetical protein AIGOOFII_2667 [Methylobacterium marchantiae]
MVTSVAMVMVPTPAMVAGTPAMVTAEAVTAVSAPTMMAMPAAMAPAMMTMVVMAMAPTILNWDDGRLARFGDRG